LPPPPAPDRDAEGGVGRWPVPAPACVGSLRHLRVLGLSGRTSGNWLGKGIEEVS